MKQRHRKSNQTILKSILALSIAIITCLPAVSEEVDATACNHNTGECYAALLNLQEDFVIIYFTPDTSKEFFVERDTPEDICAYDDQKEIYYDIEAN